MFDVGHGELFKGTFNNSSSCTFSFWLKTKSNQCIKYIKQNNMLLLNYKSNLNEEILIYTCY